LVSSEFVHFCERIGTDRAGKLLKLSICLFEKKKGVRPWQPRPLYDEKTKADP